MMDQYWDVKEAHPDCLIFYRMGDFYELFYDDAVTAAPVLDIALTKRGKGADGSDVPMCGVPAHSYEAYLPRLIKAGHKVAICEQVETPEEAKKRGGHKALVKRDVVRVMTAGTLMEDNLLQGHENNIIAALVLPRVITTQAMAGLSWMDISTGVFQTQAVPAQDAAMVIDRIGAKELLLCDTDAQNPDAFDMLGAVQTSITTQPRSLFDAKNAQARLLDLYGVKTLDGFGAFEGVEVTAAGTLLDYVRRTQKGACPHIRTLTRLTPGMVMEMDVATRRNLEILKTLGGERKGSLFHALDTTRTAAGARLLATRLSAPSCDMREINRRLDVTAHMISAPALRETLSDHLSRMPDMERALARITVRRGTPRDLGMMRDALNEIFNMRRAMQEADDNALSDLMERLALSPAIMGLQDRLNELLIPEGLPTLARDGGFIREGASTQLDEYRSLKKDGRDRIAALERAYAEETDINTLKIKHNNVLGYFIEVSSKHGDRLLGWGAPQGANDQPASLRTHFAHRQTLASAIRFTTTALSELESGIAQSVERSQAIEQELFDQMVTQVIENAAALSPLAEAASELDLATAQASLAQDRQYTRPQIFEDTRLQITGGRHPVVEASLPQGEFIANDARMDEGTALWLITGPNMAGKSTFLRQNALIALMAQAGLYVPAKAAEIGLIDRLFSRVGAADDLARGQSTFMVEMVETAAILNRATDRSFVILDEIGRGTATFDGLSIAWATLEHLHEVNACRCLFATHYHELSSLSDTLPRLTCARVDVKEWKGKIVFLHKLVEGAADQSYGIHVAKIAGVPGAVITRARQILQNLEKQKGKNDMNALPLFETAQEGTNGHEPHPALQILEDITPDDLTPREALDLLYALKDQTRP